MYIDHHPETPEENIALDEYLLLKAEEGALGETLRFWESEEYFVVVGRAGKISAECYGENCGKAGIKIIRRASGGGTVLQGPGCLNYSLILSYERDGSLRGINASYEYVLGKIATEFKRANINLEVLPVSDMAFAGKKISGNAQARKKRYFLHHGTILYDFDLAKIPVYLKYPPKEPPYRKGRAHLDFVANLPVGSERIKELIKAAFPIAPVSGFERSDLEDITRLACGKYSKTAWNSMFK